MYEIVIGRSESDTRKYGTKGAFLLGKHYVTMGQTTSLSNDMYMDVTTAHQVFICGKRGGGKSYTMGVIAEGMASLEPEISSRLSIILLDTMGIYWTMKYGNRKEADMLEEWGLKPNPLDIIIYTPKSFYEKYKSEGIPTDKPFSIPASELNPEDWWITFEMQGNDPVAVFIERIILDLKKEGIKFGIDDIIARVQKDEKEDRSVRMAAENRFRAAQDWGVFSKEGTSLRELAQGGKVTVLDVSCYATGTGGWKAKALVVGLVAQKLFIDRMIARKAEEFRQVESALSYFESSEPGTEEEEAEKMPLVWLVIDEAHEFLPVTGKTAASDALITILREGRQPGISMILATQQPGKIHTDVMTQSDIILSHRITAKLDTDALGMLMQSYMREGLDKFLNELPRTKGSALILDDSNERLYPMKIRPRFTWHGGQSPSAMPAQKKFIM